MAATLDDLRLFLDHVAEPGWRTCYSADIGIWSGKYSVTMKRKYMSESGNKKKKEETSRTFQENLELLEVIRTMIACPTWSRGDFVFNNKDDFVPELNDSMMQLFSLLGSSSSLCTFHIMFYGFYHTHLPRLLGELRFLETLILDARPMALPEHAESIAALIEQSDHSILKSCTLDLYSCNFESGSCSAVKTILRPLIHGAALKELTIRITPGQQTDYGENPVCKKLACPNCHQAMADMVRQNTSLVKFELCSSYSRDNVTALFGSALEANRSLQEFGFPCSIAGVIELSRCLQANTSLSTLKLFPPSDCYGEEFMKELGKLLRHNNTLKDVRVAKQRDGNSWPAWECENLTAAKHVERKTWDKMESIMKNELQCNTTLNSLVVGNWTLLRVANQWKLSYEGPCLTTLTTEDYDVKVDYER